MKIIDFLKHSRYRPSNILETIIVTFLNLFYIKKSKCLSFHIFRLKKRPSSTVYYNNLGRCIIYLGNFLSIVIFNKFILKNILLQNQNDGKSLDRGKDHYHWPTIHIDKYYVPENEKIIKEIEMRINKQLEKFPKVENNEEFWENDRKEFKDNFIYRDLKINFNELKNFRNKKLDFKSLIFNSDNIDNLHSRKNKLASLNLINLYHKVAELSDIDILINTTDNNIGNPTNLNYRNQIIHERLLRQVYFHSQIRNNTKLDHNKKNIFLEIGPGYGLLAKSLKPDFKNSKFILVDLPEINILSFYYLQSCFPNSKFCLSSDLSNIEMLTSEIIDRYDFFILNHSDLSKIPTNTIDCSINIASFGEMTTDTQDFYLKHIERLTKLYFYNVNRFRHDNIIFKHLRGYYEFPINGKIWNKILYQFSPSLHIETLLEKNKNE